MEVFLITALLLAAGFAGIAIKIWGKKDGEFSGTCAGNSPFLNPDGENCSFCGATPQDQCGKEEADSKTQAAS